MVGEEENDVLPTICSPGLQFEFKMSARMFYSYFTLNDLAQGLSVSDHIKSSVSLRMIIKLLSSSFL